MTSFFSAIRQSRLFSDTTDSLADARDTDDASSDFMPSAVERYARASENYEEKLIHTVEVLSQVAASYADITQASSLGAEDMVITHILHRYGIPSDIFVLDTGKLHQETLGLLAYVQQELGDTRKISVYSPDAQQVQKFVEKHGEEAMYESVELRKACCHIRKMLPLARALEGRSAWITGLRTEQSEARSSMRAIEKDDAGRVKVSPLLNWTWGDVWHYIGDNEVPYNPLHDAFYPSIGCQPCTRAISMGEPFRAGRWWWEQGGARECGLHVKGEQVISVLPPSR